MKNIVTKIVLMPVEVKAEEYIDDTGRVTYEVCSTFSTHEDANKVINIDALRFDTQQAAWDFLNINRKPFEHFICLKVKNTTILNTYGPDEIHLHLACDSTFPIMNYPAFAKITTQPGYAKEWCTKVLGIKDFEVIKAYS